MNSYLESNQIIDWDDQGVIELAKQCAAGAHSKYDIAKNCFEWVRDNIPHSGEYKLNPITCKASDVLKYKTGFCFSKSHLLAGILRANEIPTGFCYQCLSMDDVGAPYSLHGLNAIYLESSDRLGRSGWHRIDARGNNTKINAQFLPPHEDLAFTVNVSGEVDFFEVCSDPLTEVVSILESSETYQEVIAKLPITANIKPYSDIKVELHK